MLLITVRFSAFYSYMSNISFIILTSVIYTCTYLNSNKLQHEIASILDKLLTKNIYGNLFTMS